jgi:1-acyl-sn-glycerol-3-phosphate acyltransferase
MHWVYYFGRVLIRIMVFPFGSWEVKGRENVPASGPVLIVCNHLHLADPPIVAASIKLKSVIMAKEELWHNGWSRYWVENFGAFPVKRGGFDRDAIRQAEQWLKQGVSLIMFPEGTRSSNAQLQQAFPGVALIALRLGVPILPLSITGTEKFNHLVRCLWRRARITVTIGHPFYPPSHDGKLTRDQRNRLTNEIMRKIAGLLPPEYRGVYSGGVYAGGVYTGGKNAHDREGK